MLKIFEFGSEEMAQAFVSDYSANAAELMVKGRSVGFRQSPRRDREEAVIVLAGAFARGWIRGMDLVAKECEERIAALQAIVGEPVPAVQTYASTGGIFGSKSLLG